MSFECLSLCLRDLFTECILQILYVGLAKEFTRCLLFIFHFSCPPYASIGTNWNEYCNNWLHSAPSVSLRRERFEPGTLLAHALYMFLKHVPFPHDLARIECQCSSSSSSAATSGAASSVAATSGTGAAGGSAGLVSGAVPFSTAAAFAPSECSPSSSSSTSSGACGGQGQANGAQACASASATMTPTPTRTLWSHLAFSWGFIAEVDIESEILRFIGGARFKVYSIPKILRTCSPLCHSAGECYCAYDVLHILTEL